MHKVYLAGPEVFLPNAAEVGAAKKRICAAHGLEGLFPLDQPQPALPPAELGAAIYRANIALMTQADAIIANLTPFRGAAMDAGTAFEVGFCAARGIKLFFFFFNDTATTEIYTLSLHDALPIFTVKVSKWRCCCALPYSCRPAS